MVDAVENAGPDQLSKAEPAVPDSEIHGSIVRKVRPKYRNLSLGHLMYYRLPLAGKVSILHRISGLLLFIAIPVVLLPLLDMSLTSEGSFDQFRSVVDNWFVKLVLFVLLWSYLHHFCAGIRYLLLDRHVGLDKEPARQSALWVLIISLALTVVLGLKLIGVY